MGWLDSLIGGVIDYNISKANQNVQAEENVKSRDFASSQQEDAQAFNAEEAQKARDFSAEQQEDAQAFNSEEAAINRDWQSQEAAINRDFQAQQAEEAYQRQVEFYEQYQSIGAQVRQYQEAGLNPALLAGGVSVGSTPSSSAGGGSMPSGSAASSSAIGGSSASSSALGASASALPEVIGMAKEVFDLQAMKQSIENMKKQGEKISAETQNIQENTTLTKQQVAESVARINNLDTDTYNKILQRGQIAADIALSNATTEEKQANTALLIAKTVTESKQPDLIESTIEMNDKNIERMDYVIEDLIQSANLKSHQAKVAKRDYQRLIQEYGHQEVMNAITEISSSRDSGAGEYSNGYYRSISEVKRFINSLLGWFSAGANFAIKK